MRQTWTASGPKETHASKGDESQEQWVLRQK